MLILGIQSKNLIPNIFFYKACSNSTLDNNVHCFNSTFIHNRIDHSNDKEPSQLAASQSSNIQPEPEMVERFLLYSIHSQHTRF